MAKNIIFLGILDWRTSRYPSFYHNNLVIMRCRSCSDRRQADLGFTVTMGPTNPGVQFVPLVNLEGLLGRGLADATSVRSK